MVAVGGGAIYGSHLLSSPAQAQAKDTDPITQVATDSQIAPQTAVVQPKVSLNKLDAHSESVPTYSDEEFTKRLYAGIDAYEAGARNCIDDAAYLDAFSQSVVSTPDSQNYLYHKMLNALDYYTSAEGVLTYAAGNLDAPLEIHYTADFAEGKSDCSVSQNGETVAEITTADGMQEMLNCKTGEELNAPLSASLDFAIPANERICKNEAGEMQYLYRPNNITLSGAASVSLYPQELTFSLLTDFSAWEITGMTEELGRRCVSIEGTTNGNRFTLHVDLETGIVLSYEKQNATGDCVDFMRT